MMTSWTKNLKTAEDKEKFENSLRGARPILKRLSQLLIEEEEEIDRYELNLDTYSTPNWAERQAHKNGQRAILRKMKNLINLDQQKEVT